MKDPNTSILEKSAPTPTPNSTLQSALEYRQKGYGVVPIPHKSKAPKINEWPKLKLDEEQINELFNELFKEGPINIGVILGEASGGLSDVDIDAPEAGLLAPEFLPETGCKFGRPSNPSSHWIFKADPISQTEKFKDVDGTTLVELRSTATQTVFPPSVHPTGEQIEFVRNSTPTPVNGSSLRFRVATLVAATILARHWPIEGSRQMRRWH